MRKVLFRSGLLALSLLAAGCALITKPESGTPANYLVVDSQPIWRVSETPEPLPMVTLLPEQTFRISLVGAASKPIEKVLSAAFTQDIGVQIDIASESDAVTLSSDQQSNGTAVLFIEVAVAGGGSEELAVPVLAKSIPMVEFTYTPPEDKTVNRVAVAGSFNGWNSGSNVMEKGEDGIFRVNMPVMPGNHLYKLVIDGDWVPDPGNPDKQEGGYENSLLTVKGDETPRFEFNMASFGMPNIGAQGGLVADLEKGASLDPNDVTLIVNNQRLDASAYELKDDTISLNVPEGSWKDENYVTVVARATDGSEGTWTGSFAFSDAPRSPRDEVIYFAMTDRFNDGNPELNKPAKDKRVHPLANYNGGDWEGIRQKIESGYFKELGVTTIWVSPVAKNTDNVERETVPPYNYYTSYHGYWPVSDAETNEQFGSMDDLRSLVATAHEHGIAILIDFVAAHVHEDHPLRKEHSGWVIPYKTADGRDNLRLFDEFPLTTWFDSFLPKLDYDGNDELVERKVENAVYWLRTTGADGFRHDAVKHIPTIFWRKLTERIRQDFAEERGQFVYQVGETISGYGVINEYVGPDLMTGQFDFPLLWGIQSTFARGTGTMNEIGDSALSSQREYFTGSIMSPLIGNHDVIRFMAMADDDVLPGIPEKELGFTHPPHVDDPVSYDKIQLAFAFLMSLPGPPTIYYGDEIGLTGAHDPDNRRMMHFGDWNDEEANTFQTVVNLANGRHESVALRRGKLEKIYGDDERLVLARVSPEETVLISLSRKPTDEFLSLPLPERWGTPKQIEPMMTKKTTLTVRNQSIEIEDGDYGFGFWRLTY